MRRSWLRAAWVLVLAGSALATPLPAADPEAADPGVEALIGDRYIDPPDGLPPGSTPPADFVTPVAPPSPTTLPGSTPFADAADGPFPA